MEHSLNTQTIVNFLIIGLLSIPFIVPVSAVEDDIEEVIVKGKVLYADQVNALKTPIAVLNVPQSVSIITDEDMRKQGFRQIEDIIRYTPGVNASQGEGHRDSVVFRGIRSTADFFQDGIRDDVQYHRSLYNVEQIEILRGPNALLFGRGGAGGALNRVTKKAVFADTFGAIDFGLDDFGATDIALDYNIPSSSNSAIRLMIHGDVLKNHRDFYDGDRLGINPTLAIQVSDRTTLDLAYEYADHERYVDRGIPTENGKPVKRFSNITFSDSKGGNFSLLEADIFRATLSTDYSNTTKGNLAIISSEFKKMYQNYYVAEYSAGESVVTVDGYKDPTERDNTIISANLINELDIGSTTHTLLFGVEVIDTFNKNERYDAYWSTSMSDTETFNIKRPINFLLNSSGFSTINDFNTDLNSQTQSEIEVTSFFFQDQIDVSKYLKLLIGGRHDNFNITVKDLKNGTAQAREDTEFSPRAGIIFKPIEKASFYFSYSESFLPRSGEQFKSLSPISAALDPDIFESSEIGIKMDVSDNLNFTLAYFDSEQLIAARDSMSGETSEIVGLQVDGLELEVKGEINNRMNVVFGYSSLDGRTFKGGEPREIPDSTLSLFATYEVSDNFSWALGYIQQGESNIANDNPDLVLPKFTRVDLGAYYQMTSDFSIQINIENLMDELYFPHSHSTHQVSVGEPLNIRVSARKTF